MAWDLAAAWMPSTGKGYGWRWYPWEDAGLEQEKPPPRTGAWEPHKPSGTWLQHMQWLVGLGVLMGGMR